MTNEEFLKCAVLYWPEDIYQHAKKLVAVAEAAKDYVEGRSVEFGILELEDALEYLERV